MLAWRQVRKNRFWRNIFFGSTSSRTLFFGSWVLAHETWLVRFALEINAVYFPAHFFLSVFSALNLHNNESDLRYSGNRKSKLLLIKNLWALLCERSGKTYCRLRCWLRLKFFSRCFCTFWRLMRLDGLASFNAYHIMQFWSHEAVKPLHYSCILSPLILDSKIMFERIAEVCNPTRCSREGQEYALDLNKMCLSADPVISAFFNRHIGRFLKTYDIMKKVGEKQQRDLEISAKLWSQTYFRFVE